MYQPKEITKIILLWIPIIGFMLWIFESFSDSLYSQKDNVFFNGTTWGVYQGSAIVIFSSLSTNWVIL